MTNPIKSRLASAGSPVIVFANWFHFEPGSTIAQSSVESRMLLWCRSGVGRVRVNGRWLALAADDWLFLPWGREIIYEGAAKDPFVTGAIHLIPHHDPKVPVHFDLAHHRKHPLSRLPYRADREWPGLEGIVHGTMPDILRLLATYIIESFHPQRPTEATMRPLAELLHHELTLAAREGKPTVPAALRRIMEYVNRHPSEKLTVGDLARFQDCGEATLFRLFKTFLKTTPTQWMASRRAEAAGQLLRTTNWTVEEIGRRVGIENPFQFSRFFKKQQGASPRAYRRLHQKF